MNRRWYERWQIYGRKQMMRYEIRGEIDGIGQVKHVVKATDQIAAWERIKKAYKKRKTKVIQIRELKDGRKK